MANAPTLDQLIQDRDAKQQAAIEAQAAANDAHAAHAEADAKLRAAKVSAIDPKVVEEAQSWGINPENFGDTAHLQEAINIASKTRTKAEQLEQTKPGAMSEADAA